MFYKEAIAKFKINGEVSDGFEIKTGVMEGIIPSPILFINLFDFIIKKSHRRSCCFRSEIFLWQQ
jgi:hypothetical protein